MLWRSILSCPSCKPFPQSRRKNRARVRHSPAESYAPSISQLYYILGTLEETENQKSAVERYKASVAWDSTNLRSQRRLLELQPYALSRESIPQRLPSSPALSRIVKKELLLSLCQTHPYLISRQQLMESASSTHNTETLLTLSRCLLTRNALAESELLLRRLYDRGVRCDSLFFALGAVLYLREDKNGLFALLQSLSTSSNSLSPSSNSLSPSSDSLSPSTPSHSPFSTSLSYGFLMGLHALVQRDYYEALRHFNLLLTKCPSRWQVWVAIGVTRSAMVSEESGAEA